MRVKKLTAKQVALMDMKAAKVKTGVLCYNKCMRTSYNN